MLKAVSLLFDFIFNFNPQKKPSISLNFIKQYKNAYSIPKVLLKYLLLIYVIFYLGGKKSYLGQPFSTKPVKCNYKPKESTLENS